MADYSVALSTIVVALGLAFFLLSISHILFPRYRNFKMYVSAAEAGLALATAPRIYRGYSSVRSDGIDPLRW